MWQYTVKVDGMMCGMCEAHANDAIRREIDVKKISSSHTKGETVFVVEDEVEEAKIRAALAPTGYDIGAITKEPYKKKKFLGLF